MSAAATALQAPVALRRWVRGAWAAGWSYGTPLWEVEGSFIDLTIDRAEFR